MQEILINDSNIDFILEQEKTVHEVLQSLRTSLKHNHELFYSITIDSKKISPNELENIETMELDNIHQLAIQTVKIDDIKQLVAIIEDISILLHRNKVYEAMNIISGFTVEISSLLEAIQYNFDITNTDLQKCSHILLSKLHELVASLETNDVIMIGDLLEYEIAPQITNLIDIVSIA